MGSRPTANIQRVAIVGGGPAGIAAARHLRAEHHFSDIVIFEQQHKFGGVWNYSDQCPSIPVPQIDPGGSSEAPIWSTVIHRDGSKSRRATFVTPMYDKLETNIPHCLMKHSGAPSLEDHQLFPTRQEVGDYLSEYAQDVADLVRFQTQVINVRPEFRCSGNIWRVATKNLLQDEVDEHEYDAVVVANGHYNVPHLPDIKGIKQWNGTHPGTIAHSKAYRNPDKYKGQKVLVVGNSASGIDISAQIACVAKQPILVSQKSQLPLVLEAAWKRNLPQISEFLCPERRAIRFTDGQVETGVDAILFCTGYYYSYPFLSSIERPFVSSGERVEHLYRHLFSIDHPSLAFIGLPSKIIPFRTFEGQAAVIARTWSGRLHLPSRDQMQAWEDAEIRDKGSGKSFHVMPFPQDFEYHNAMIQWASGADPQQRGLAPMAWSEKESWQRPLVPAIKKAFAERGEERHGVRRCEQLGFVYESQ